MMPIVTLQRQFRELGRLRLGQQVEFEKNGRTMKRPEKLDTWRLTSPDRSLLEAAAAVYKGEVVAWPEAPDGDEWQLITETDELDIIVPPGRTISQWNEMWSGGGCQRRCDGEREWLKNTPCLCPADPTERNALASKGEACKPTTRLQVILPQLPDLGTWLYVSHGYYAAVELAGTAELLAAAAMQGGQMVKASLWIDQRTVKRPGQGARHFPVAAIRIKETMTSLLGASNGRPGIVIEGGRVPAQLETSAPLPADPSFDQPPAGETASVAQARAGQPDASSTTPPAAPTRPADAPMCRHDPKDHQNTEQGMVCGACGTVLAQRDQPAASVAGAGAAPVARGGGESSGSSSAANHSAQSEATPPGGSSPAPAPTTMADAQSRVGALAIQHRLVGRIQTDQDWDAFDAVLRSRGLEPPPLEASPEAIAEWNALGDRIAAGEFDAAPVAADGDPMGKCQAHDLPWKHVEAGKNTVTGKKWNAFWCCPTRDCEARPTKAWRDRQKAGA